MQSSWQRDGSPDTTITASVAATPRRILVNVRGSLTRAGVPAHPSRRVPVDRSRAHRTCRSALRELGLRRRQRAVEAYAADEPCKTALHSGAAGPGHGELARVPDAAPGESFAVRDCAANPGGPTRVHFGCIRSPSAVVSGRLTSPRNWRFAALLTTGDDCRLPLTFSDKEEVPGSSPGSPIGGRVGGRTHSHDGRISRRWGLWRQERWAGAPLRMGRRWPDAPIRGEARQSLPRRKCCQWRVHAA